MPRFLLPALTAVLGLHLAFAGGDASSAPGTLNAFDDSPAGSADEEMVQMGRRIPGFGGLYYDVEGRPNVYLLEPDGAGRSALKSLGAGDIRVRQGDYEFARLLAWRRELRPVLALPGVVLLDVDEAANRVVVGIDSASGTKSLDRDGLERKIQAMGIPRQAVVLRETARFEPMTGLRDKLRPAPGGAQIVFLPFSCTLGFNAFRGRDFGFVTNSHCTDVRGEVTGTRYFQSTPASGAIGTEIADPAFSTGPPCPAGRRCRFSDSAFAKYDKPSLGGLGKIARPLSAGSDMGSLTLKNPSARFTITARVGSPLEGQVVHKVGRTTGWTFGTVVATCADVNSGSSDASLFCQSVVRSGVAGGDSGSPVFFSLPGNKARLAGILWGGGSDPQLGTLFVFSPLENIEAELGALRVN